jgi:hypothetical protein
MWAIPEQEREGRGRKNKKRKKGREKSLRRKKHNTRNKEKAKTNLLEVDTSVFIRESSLSEAQTNNLSTTASVKIMESVERFAVVLVDGFLNMRQEVLGILLLQFRLFPDGNEAELKAKRYQGMNEKVRRTSHHHEQCHDMLSCRTNT